MLHFLNRIFYQSLVISGGKSPFKKGNLKNSPNLLEEKLSFLGKNTVLEEKMSFKGELRLDGKFDGKILESEKETISKDWR